MLLEVILIAAWTQTVTSLALSPGQNDKPAHKAEESSTTPDYISDPACAYLPKIHTNITPI